jgi:hypothetical protein
MLITFASDGWLGVPVCINQEINTAIPIVATSKYLTVKYDNNSTNFV